MVNGRGNFFWQQTSSIESLIININRKANSKTIHPDELNPYAVKERGTVKQKATMTGKAAWDFFKNVVQSGVLSNVSKKQ